MDRLTVPLGSWVGGSAEMSTCGAVKSEMGGLMASMKKASQVKKNRNPVPVHSRRLKWRMSAPSIGKSHLREKPKTAHRRRPRSQPLLVLPCTAEKAAHEAAAATMPHAKRMEVVLNDTIS